MQGYISGQETPLDDLPSWKRELILRKRANVRIHGGFGLPTPPAPMAGRGRGSLSGPTSPTSSSLSGQHHGVVRSVSGPSPSIPTHPTQPQLQPHENTAVSSRLEGVRATLSAGGSDDGKSNPQYAVISEVSSVSPVPVGAMHHKGLHDTGPRVASPTYSTVSDSYGHEDEELRYGPGIVSKLKNRYMSLAMRENRSRPSLRKFSSLEDLLDSEPRHTWQESGISASKPRVTQDPSASHRREVMRRARSVDSLSSRLAEDTSRAGARSSRMPKSKSASSRLQSSLNPLAKDDVIIIETSNPTPQEQKAMNGNAKATLGGGEPPALTRNLSTSSSQAEEEDMPPPDTVRQVKRIFETGDRPVRGTAAKVAAHKVSHGPKSNGVALASKPALKAKPVNVPPRKVTPPAGPAQHITIEEAKSSLRKVAQSNRPSPRTTLGVRATAASVNGEKTTSKKSDKGSSSSSRVRSGLTPVTSSVTAPLVNGGDPVGRQAHSESEQCVSAVQAEEGVRRVSTTAVQNIRKESQSKEFNFVSGSVSLESGQVPPVSTPKQSSPTPSPLPSSPVASHRVPSHSPFGTPVERAQENDRVQQENLKNVEKSRSLPPVESPKTEVLTPSKADKSKQAKVDTSKPGPKVEQFKPSPRVEPKHSTPKKVEPKAEVRTPPVKTETVKPTPSPAEELVRSPGRGSLVEAVNTSNQPAFLSSPVSSPITTKTASSRDRWHQQDNTIVFNFTGTKKETPDYIENDGIDLSRRRPEVSTNIDITDHYCNSCA
ncbi:hypothetical protein Pcinc_041745 [Petrolisthes cinctipes]|uniref:Uncharacterized protein n=1 Tax=Petrolisthes cinctipes TaxID=88211 RepID=A0AAE1EGN7_PETCI|nr:hypothetical protein Pcinc_041745 [Petrolisthes cinctipes]